MYGSSYACSDGYKGFVFQPLYFMSLIIGSYLECFSVMACYGNQSWQYVNLMKWIIFVCDGVKGVGCG